MILRPASKTVLLAAFQALLWATCPMALDSRKDDNMQLFWGTIAIVSAAAIVGGIVYMIRGELRAWRRRQAMNRLRAAEVQITRERADYSRFNQDQLLRNRSERWDGQ
jgi:hypothetical protein